MSPNYPTATGVSLFPAMLIPLPPPTSHRITKEHGLGMAQGTDPLAPHMPQHHFGAKPHRSSGQHLPSAAATSLRGMWLKTNVFGKYYTLKLSFWFGHLLVPPVTAHPIPPSAFGFNARFCWVFLLLKNNNNKKEIIIKEKKANQKGVETRAFPMEIPYGNALVHSFPARRR